MSHIYGPVNSRRFGVSLGLDPLPPGTCSFGCVYCQAGPKVSRHLDFLPGPAPEDLASEVVEALATRGRPEVITLAGSGEPTLYAGLPKLAELLRPLELPLLLITNGSMLGRPELRGALGGFHMIAPSLDAFDEASFRAVNSPHPDLHFADLLAGIAGLRSHYQGLIFLEVMLVRGLSDSDAALSRLAAIVAELDVDRIDVNTPVRPGPGGVMLAVDREQLHDAAARFGPRAREVAFEPERFRFQAGAPAGPEQVLGTISRRPSSAEELQRALGVAPDALAGILAGLVGGGQVLRAEDGRFFVAGEGDGGMSL